MEYTIQNEALRVSAEAFGAQLTSIQGKDGVERLWQGDPDIWKGRAPILFPLIGRLKNETYTLEGKSYRIPIHGFGQRVAWELTDKSDTAMTFLLKDTEETRAQYPFRFACEVTYALEGAVLVKTHRVRNESDTPMYYEIGGHDGYRTTLTPGEKMADSYIEFPAGVTALHPIVNDSNLMLTRDTREVPLENGRFYLKPGVFALDALILQDLPERRLTLASDKNDRRVTVRFDDYPYVGIWSRPKDFDTDYVCIEPWSALPDAAYLGTELSEKLGVRTLAPGAEDVLRYSMEFV